MIALSPRQTKVFVLPLERNLQEDKQTKFILAPITVQDENIIRDASFVRDGKHMRYSGSTKQYWALQVGLKDVQNLKDADGNIVPMEREKEAGEFGIYKITDSFLSRIDANSRGVIANEIISMFEIDFTTAKN